MRRGEMYILLLLPVTTDTVSCLMNLWFSLSLRSNIEVYVERIVFMVYLMYRWSHVFYSLLLYALLLQKGKILIVLSRGEEVCDAPSCDIGHHCVGCCLWRVVSGEEETSTRTEFPYHGHCEGIYHCDINCAFPIQNNNQTIRFSRVTWQFTHRRQYSCDWDGYIRQWTSIVE